ncbi:nucleotidyltransferase domain-containing protein [Paenibacillus wynnii]|uniref:nucleotidyltransferase domain-containing protein n=1 Tax=Paenibacillus wynnii TaxID=268407 RepID=UPI0027926235|nr:putative nucleotidyltransferase [Paenibacillus wynnii]
MKDSSIKFNERYCWISRLKELSGNLLGIYLHGSLAMGCFNPLKSDIDFLIVVKDKLTPVNNSRIAKIALSLHDEMSNERGIEFTG